MPMELILNLKIYASPVTEYVPVHGYLAERPAT
jgi:hypothetical protein